MSKQPAAPEAGGEPPSRARATNTAPPTRELNASVQSERQAVPGGLRDGVSGAPRRGRAQIRTTYDDRERTGEDATPATPSRLKPSYVPLSQRRREQPQATPSRPAVEQPPFTGSRPPCHRSAPIEPVSPFKEEDGTEAEPTPKPRPRIHPQPELLARILTACCVLFFLLFISTSITTLVIYLVYRPHPPRLTVAAATLSAGGPRQQLNRSLPLKSTLTVLANISNPNDKIDIVLRSMELDLFLEGDLVATQAVQPAPLQERPGETVQRRVRLVVSRVATGRHEDVLFWGLWQNRTGNSSLVRLQLAGQFRTQLRFGRWLRYTYWVYPGCNLELDPARNGTLSSAHC